MPSPSVGRTPDRRQRAARDAVLVAVLRTQVRRLNCRALGVSPEAERLADNAEFVAELDAIGVTDRDYEIAITMYNGLLTDWVRSGYTLIDGDEAAA